MAISLMQDRLARLVLTDPAEDRFEDPQLLPPMFLGNDAGISHCMTGTDFQGRVLRHEVIMSAQHAAQFEADGSWLLSSDC